MPLVMEGTCAVWDPPVDPKQIKTALPGQLRIVYVDVRDGWPTAEHDCPDLPAVQAIFRNMFGPTAACMEVYDDTGRRVDL